MNVERSGGARAGAARGDGLAPVTYLPGVQPPAPSDPPTTELPTLASVFGELESQIATTLAERRAADEYRESPEARADAKAKERAERVSMHALTRRGMSKREVERSLRARELDDETVASELDRLEGVGLIDDMALAQNLVGILQERKGLGRSAVAAELTRRLLAPAAIEYALDLIETSDELGRAKEIAVKRAGQLRSYDRETALRRLSAFLARRGYSGSTIRSAVEHALPATPTSTVRFR
ncbi:regulatory protein RecX [Lysinimonas soli]|uniref:Regulatory protein RecX n=1 Tax=Lysinimonas soli TaxID=1074233 RepID=A0ABW0NM43_9MICO